MSDDPLDYTPDVQNGYVSSIAEVGDKVIVAGTFTSVKQNGDPTAYTRNYLFAYDKATGQLDTSFVPTLDAQVDVVKPAGDGTSVFIGGKFANVNGSPNFGLAKLDVNTGQQVAGFSGTTAGRVRDLSVAAGKVYIGGDIWSVNGVQKSRLAAVDATTGAVDPTFDVGTTLPRNTVDWVAKLDVNPAATELVIIGNFLEVDNLSRKQIAKIDLTGPQATVMDWSTEQFGANCSNNFWTYMRDIEYSPNGSYLVTATTGGPFLNTLCDTASRWDTGETGSGLLETWSDWSGGDTLTAVAVTDVSVYIGGHQRWMNNHTGRDFAGIGAVSRAGIAALDPINGVPFSWNPGKSRGVAVYDLHASADTLYVGSDTDFAAGEYHAKIAAFPTAGGTVVPLPTPEALPSDLYAARTDGSFALRSYDGTTFGSASAVADPIDWSSAGGAFHEAGKVYYIDGDDLTSRTYDGANWGPAVLEPSWTSWPDNESLAWDNGRVYYTINNDSDLYYHYLSLESGLVGSQTFTASGGIDWSDVSGLAFVDSDLYYASSDGNLRRAAMVDGTPDSASVTVVSGPGAGDGLDWDNVNGLFFLSFDFGPSVNITDPGDGASVDGVITVTATATDDDGVDQVEFFADAASIGVDTNGADGWSVSWDTATTGDGTVVLTATATDTGGNTASDAITVTVDNDGPSVTITAPADGSTVSGSVLVVTDATDTVGVSQVEFFVDGTSIGVDSNGADGWSVNWSTSTSPDGTAAVSATATDLNSKTASDAISVTVDNAAAGVVLYVVGNPSSITSGAAAVIDRLEADGYVVTVIDDNVVTAADAAGTSFVIIGSSTNSSAVGTKFVGVAQPVWNAKPWNFDDMGYTGTTSGVDFGSSSSTTIDIVDATHPIAVGLSGTVGFTTSNRSESWGQPAVAADVVATVNGLPTIFVYEAGDLLADGSTAAGCRLTFPLFTSAPTKFTTDAWAMFDAMADFAGGGCVIVPANPPPTMAVTSPAGGSTLTGIETVTATATDPDGVAQVEFFIDGVSIGVDTDDSDGWSSSWDTTATGDGAAVMVTATGTDSLGASGSDSVLVAVDNDGPTVTITAPNDGSTVGGTISVVADAVDAVGVAQVEFFVDGGSIGVDTDGGNGWSVLWDTTAFSGSTAVSATATDTSSATDSDAIAVTVDNSSAGVVLFVVGNPANLNAGDTAVKDRLEANGYTVTLVDDGAATSGDAVGTNLVVIASSVNSNGVGSTFNGVSVPVWDSKPWHFDDIGLTGTAPNADYGSTSTSTVDIVDDSHPLAAGLSGTVNFTSSNKSVTWGQPAAAGDVVATANGMPTIFAYDAGDLLADGSTAAGCRFSFPIFTSGPTAFTTDGWNLFDVAAAFGASGCTGTPPPPAAAPTAIVISIDALKADTVAALGATELPNIFRLINEGSSTDNARTVVESTNTLPNHLSIVTGRPVLGGDGHLVTFNEDDGLTIHDTAGQYIASMFDVAHDNGLDTLLYASKPKFDFLDRSWDAANGAADVTGADDGTDKIDFYMRSDGATITNAFVTQMGVDVVELSLIHYGITDGEAHAFGFESPEYEQALRDVDGWIGEILTLIDGDPLLADTVIVLATDHAGTGLEHNDETAAVNYTIPLYVWGSGVAAGSDIYTETGATRLDPGTAQPAYTDPVQPVRNADIANLALEALELNSVPGSVINPSQDLNVIP